MSASSERLSHSLEAQLLEQCWAFADGIAAHAISMPSETVEAVAEHAIEEVLVVFAQHTRGPGAARFYTALSAHLREGVRRRLDDLRNPSVGVNCLAVREPGFPREWPSR